MLCFHRILQYDCDVVNRVLWQVQRRTSSATITFLDYPGIKLV